ncbi:MAG: hypothetical protein KF861_08600, partial [Planctomycetaceae bacterium]|nr:hypothetical protein [Planctomycetaceae bacterium]
MRVQRFGISGFWCVTAMVVVAVGGPALSLGDDSTSLHPTPIVLEPSDAADPPVVSLDGDAASVSIEPPHIGPFELIDQ